MDGVRKIHRSGRLKFEVVSPWCCTSTTISCSSLGVGILVMFEVLGSSKCARWKFLGCGVQHTTTTINHNNTPHTFVCRSLRYSLWRTGLSPWYSLFCGPLRFPSCFCAWWSMPCSAGRAGFPRCHDPCRDAGAHPQGPACSADHRDFAAVRARWSMFLLSWSCRFSGVCEGDS